MLIRRPHEIVVVKTTRSPGWAGFGEAVMVHELIPTVPVSTAVVVVARTVVVVARTVVVVARTVLVVLKARMVVVVARVFAPGCSVLGQPPAGAGMMSSSWSSCPPSADASTVIAT